MVEAARVVVRHPHHLTLEEHHDSAIRRVRHHLSVDDAGWPRFAAAQTGGPSTRELERMNWMEYREWIPGKIQTVLVPLGTMEAHGVTANGADILAPVAIAKQIAPKLNAMIAPVIPLRRHRRPRCVSGLVHHSGRRVSSVRARGAARAREGQVQEPDSDQRPRRRSDRDPVVDRAGSGARGGRARARHQLVVGTRRTSRSRCSAAKAVTPATTRRRSCRRSIPRWCTRAATPDRK